MSKRRREFNPMWAIVLCLFLASYLFSNMMYQNDQDKQIKLIAEKTVKQEERMNKLEKENEKLHNLVVAQSEQIELLQVEPTVIKEVEKVKEQIHNEEKSVSMDKPVIVVTTLVALKSLFQTSIPVTP